MNLIELKTARLTGEALGWAVGCAEGLDLHLAKPDYNGIPWRVLARYRATVTERTVRYNPQEDWALAGKLIEKYNIDLCFERKGVVHGYSCHDDGKPSANGDGIYGKTHLDAVCRSVVMNKLGHTVQVPRELMP